MADNVKDWIGGPGVLDAATGDTVFYRSAFDLAQTSPKASATDPRKQLIQQLLPPWRPTALMWGATAGGAGVVALGAFYRALALGRMTLVGPVSATAVALPVIVGLALGQRPHPVQVAGIAATSAVVAPIAQLCT